VWFLNRQKRASGVLLIITLIKGVPARTTQVIEVGGVLNREAMDIVLNPHDSKAIEAVDFVKRRVGGKIVALSMGPDMKLVPIMKPLFDAEVSGVDEEYVLTDRRMAGADTLATSYAVALGIVKVLKTHLKPMDDLIEAIRKGGSLDPVKSKALELYRANLLPNRVYSELAPVRDSMVERFLRGELTAEETVSLLEKEKETLCKFIVVSGMKTTDGETGSVGPQVAEGVSELLGKVVPHATYVEDFDIDPVTLTLFSERKLGSLSQKLQMLLPALLTISSEYRPRDPVASNQILVRYNNYRGKLLEATKWNGEDLGADPQRLGFAGSPTIVGPGIDIGKLPVQKVVGRSLAFARKVEPFEFQGERYGPFDRGDLAGSLPPELLSDLQAQGVVTPFDYDMLSEELLR
jgi:electron transfer flavoprotein beta subunit